MNINHFRDLREFAVRDKTRLTLGAEILVAHVPTAWPRTTGWRDPYDSPPIPSNSYAVRGTVVATGPLLFISTAREDIFFFETSSGRVDHRFFSDAGVVPYPGDFYNPSNYVLLLSELEEAGIKLDDSSIDQPFMMNYPRGN